MKMFGNLLNKDSMNLESIKKPFEKAVVRAHQRKTKSGKLSQVKQYSDSRQKKTKDLNKMRMERPIGHVLVNNKYFKVNVGDDLGIEGYSGYQKVKFINGDKVTVYGFGRKKDHSEKIIKKRIIDLKKVNVPTISKPFKLKIDKKKNMNVKDLSDKKENLNKMRMERHRRMDGRHISLVNKFSDLKDSLKNKKGNSEKVKILNKLETLHGDISELHNHAHNALREGNLKSRNNIKKEISQKLKQSKELRNKLKELNGKKEKDISKKENININKKEIKDSHVNYLVKQLAYGSAGEPDENYANNYVKEVHPGMLNKVKKYLQDMSDSGFKVTKKNLEDLAMGDEDTLEKIKEKKYKGFNELNRTLSKIYNSHS